MPPEKPYLPLALALITQWEGFEPDAYQDSTGTWTIGYGFTTLNGKPVTRTTPSILQVDALPDLTKRIQQISNQLDLECFEPLTAHQRAACISLAYNIGIGRFGQSELLKYLNDGAYGAACNQFGQFTYSKGLQLKGLVNRRAAEQTCFDTAD